ncbi:hypothetical protein [Oerskovia flava]|uniref:hypothetical protein n=1 Tax=Oerskovia flava TaxID=2986422 RepID=UPI00223F9086|nr:hypothetical protein [Oerskovia sp. JB1-3-2]
MATPLSPPDDAEDAPLDPAASMRLIQAQQERAQSLEVDGRLLYGVWGVAWFVGYLLLFGSARGDIGPRGPELGENEPAGWAFAVYGSLLIGALVVTLVHVMVRCRGIRGASALTGAMYGWSWFLGFGAMGAVLAGLARAGADGELMGLASNALASLVVGLIYLSGGALWRTKRLYVLGAWILCVAAVATFAGLPTTYLVMGALGGGGFLVLMAVEHVLRVRARRAIDR